MWVYLCLVVCVAMHADGSALRCTPGTDEPCEIEQIDKDIQVLPMATARGNSNAECQAGTEWESNCHTCYCSDDGAAHCIRQEICEKGIYSEPIRCKPQSTFQRECNTCVCLENGLGMCTLRGCGRSSTPKKSDLPAGDQCASGSRWTSQCNDCSCSPDGKAICTDKACPGQENERLLTCAPDTAWKRDCNTCWCNSQGRSMCTKMGCISSKINDFNPNKETADFPDIKDPAEPSSKSTENATKAVVCAANRMFIKDCNTCWCNEDGTSYFCTRKVCVPELPEENAEVKPEDLRVINRECRPDEVFELDCNMCRCNPDGKSFSCTRRACVPEEDVNVKNASLTRKVRATAQELKKSCQPGQEFRMDCNKCLCDNEGLTFSCTRIDCNNGGTRRKREVQSTPSNNCTPGETFKVDCNMCICSPSKVLDCTNLRCQKKQDEERNNIDSDPGFRCNPGEQYKRDCQDCTCSADGRSVFCTLRLCDEN